MAEQVIDLTPEQRAQAEQLSGIGIDLTPEQETQARQLSGQLDPLLDFTPDQLSALEISDPENFNIRREYLNRPDLHKSDVLMRAALANQKVRARYDTPSAVTEVSESLPELLKPAAPVVEKFIAEQIPVVLRPAVRIAGAGKQLIDTAKTVTPGKAAKAVWHFASGLAKYAANSIAGAASPFVPEEARQNYRRLAAENLAASEQQITGFFGDIKAGTHKAAQAAGIAKPFSEYDPTEARELFLADLDREILQEETARGKGPVTRQIGGEVIAELESVGKPVRPEEVAKLTDPFTFYAYAKGFGVAGGLVPAEAKAAANSASRWVGEVGRDITGTALEGIGESARILSKGTTALSKVPAQVIPSSVLPPIVLPLIKRAAKVLPDVSEGVKSVGKQIRTGEFVSPSARLIADIAETAPGALGDITGGVAFDIGTTAAMAEFPEEEIGGGVGIGTAFGLIGAGRHVTRRVISGQEIASRVWGGKTQIPTSGPFKGSEFDTLHGTAYQTATPAIKQRVNAVREFLKKAAPGVDLFYVPDKAAFETSLVNAGVPATDARLWADQSGVFVKDLNGKRVAFAIDIDAAPHESFHPFQDVIGETANNILNQKVKSAYTDAEFEREGMRYASRLGWDGRGDWRDFTLDASGEGYHATIDKLAQEAANIIKLSEGKEPTPAEAKEQGTRMFAEAMAEATAANPDIDPNIIRRSVWRGILTKVEQKALADNYAANELAAETWDAVFKHTGPGMKDPKGLIPKFARVAGNLVAMMGGEPLAGRESQIGELPLKRAAVDAVREAVRSKLETPPLIGGETAIPRKAPSKPSPSAPTRPGAPVGTPEQEAEITKTVAAAAPEQPTGPEVDAQSPREILGTFAESKATGQGVKITRRTAPGTPAGAIEVSRGKRREQIETARGIPDDQKPLWEKNFTPVKTVVLNDGSIQEQGWSPEVLAANAEKTAKFLSDTNPSLSPFEIDTTQKTFTASGWKNLFDKVNIFAANQATGLTGKGTPLVIGRAREFGFFEPVGTREAAGTLTDAEANFINYLFGFPLPGKGPVLKRGGKAQFGEQLITEATEPGRAQPLVEPRTFGSKQAEQLGFAGEQLLEVNPLRAQIEQAGANPPSLIEAWQNLNLKDIVRADIAPELQAVRPVGVTLRAGLAPKPTKEITERFKSSAPEVKDEAGAPKIFYHGSFKMADMIESLKESGFDISKTSNVSLFGPGFYFTSDPNVAGGPYWRNKIRSWFGKEPLGYAFKPTSANDFFPEPFPKFNAEAISELGGTPGIYPAFLDLKNPLNMEKHYPNAELRPILDNILSKSGAGKGYYETVFQGYGRDGWGITGQGFYRHLADLSGAIKKGRSSSSDFGVVNKWLQEAGFDGIAYVGGVRRKGTSLGKHSVMVAFKNEQIVSPYSAGVEEIGQLEKASETAQTRDNLEANLFRRERQFSPSKDRKEIELEGPDGKKYRAMFDGYMDMSLINLGWVPQITPLQDLPGSKIKGSTTYGPSLEKAGYKLPADLPPPEITESGEAKFSPKAGKELDDKLKLSSSITKNPDGTPKPFYHGTGSAKEVSEEGFKLSKADPNALYGPGFYVTDAPHIAGGTGEAMSDFGYAQTKGGSSAGVIPVFLNVKNPFNADKIFNRDQIKKTFGDQIKSDFVSERPSLDPVIRSKVDEAVAHYLDSESRFADFDESNMEHADWKRVALDENAFLSETEKTAAGIDSYIDWLTDNSGNVSKLLRQGHGLEEMSGKDIYRALRDSLGNKTSVNQYLEDKGFDGITHEGGSIVTVRGLLPDMSRTHQVMIAFRQGQLFSMGGETLGNAESPPPRVSEQDVISLENELTKKYGENFRWEIRVPPEELAKLVTLHQELRGPSLSLEQYSKREKDNLLFELRKAAVYAENQSRGHYLSDTERKSDYAKVFSEKDVAIRKKIEQLSRKDVQYSPKQSKEVSDLAEKYAEKVGIDYTTPKGYVQYPRETAKKFAKFYDDAIHSPDDPVVKTSYDAFKRETLDQWNEIVEAGYELEPIISVDSPYRNGADVARDIEANKHLAFNLSESAFGQEGQSENQLMLEPTGINLAGRDLSFNDIFRAVHDFFGHAKQGFSFGPRGEFNAWREHANLYSPEAQGALAAETVGQTAWTQLEPSLLGPTGELLKPGDAGFVKRSERPFAEQKNIVVPEELIAEARGVQFAPRKKKEADPLKFLGTQHGSASKAWILPSGKVEQLGAQWHHDWLSENTEVAAKYKIDVPAFEGTDTEGVREGALKKGFARVNLDNGVLVVEVREKNWRNVRPIIEDLIEKNLDDIDRFRVGLLNDTATDLRKTFTAKLFDADNDQAKMERVYEAFSEEAQREIGRETRFSPKREQFEDPETIREALSSPGWAVITGTQEALGKWNVPANIEANKALEAELQEKGYEYIPVKGTYGGVPQGSDFLVMGISTYDAQAMGKKYKQQSVLTPKGLLYSDGTIRPGDTENTLLGPEATKEEFFSTLPNGLSFSVPIDFSKAPFESVSEQSTLFGGREYESPANFTQAELKQRYPEAIVPKNSKEKIGSDIVNSPLYKQSENPVNAFADKLVEFTRQYEDNPVYQLGLKWYSDIVPMLKKEFGKDAPMMTELLAASSPNEKPDMNFFYAVDALEGFKSGRFDKIVSKFNEGFDLYKSDKWLSWYNRELKAGNIVNPPKEPTPEAFLANWIYKHDLKPKQSNGQLYGFHGRAILEVLAGKWLQENKGPKVANFVQNLQGTGHEATIDVWADRTMRRIGYADTKNRWRIMPANGEGVSDADFAFSQKAFRAAANKLGIEADSLQGGLWFAEKSLWADNGWGRIDLGSYAVEMVKLPFIRANIKQRLSATKQRAKVEPMETGELKFSPKGEKKIYKVGPYGRTDENVLASNPEEAFKIYQKSHKIAKGSIASKTLTYRGPYSEEDIDVQPRPTAR